MHGKVVAILESRTGEHLGELIAKRGGTPLLAPALSELPDIDLDALRGLLRNWRAAPIEVAIFQTGVGTRALFEAADALGLAAELASLLAAAMVVVRGPKPTGELNARGIRIDRRARSPFTTEDVLVALADVDLAAVRVLVQRYGAENAGLHAALEARGAQVREIATYRWALPEDLSPLRTLLGALSERRVDAVVFTSAVQVQHLLEVAAREGRADRIRADLQRCLIASIGPVCTKALQQEGLEPNFEASPPKLGPLVAGLEALLGNGEPDPGPGLP
jgi:uroporphyrinogen-III synthase